MSRAVQSLRSGVGSPETMQARGKTAAHLTIAASYLFGGLSLLGLFIFLVLGSFELIPLGLSKWKSSGLNAGLCLLFFAQHSGMIRRSFRQWLATAVPPSFHMALYSAASGIALLTLLALWQRSETVIWSASGALAVAAWGLFAAALLGFWWGIRALGSFDTFGSKALLNSLGGQEPESMPLTVRGPYRFVRHPLYTAALVMLWACPTVTLDRLLFSILWTVWVVIGTVLEERDLVSEFGESYRDYQQAVPMLLPWRGGSWPNQH